MTLRTSLVTGEWYHCCNRGTDKRTVFKSAADYERFIALLFTSNGTRSVQLSDLNGRDPMSVFDKDIVRGDQLVDIAVYTLMPNHAHLVVRQMADNGLALFMQKLFTGYTMYFNRKYERSGALFQGSFRSRHIDSDEYLKQVIPYVLLNPVELFEKRWKSGFGNERKIAEQLRAYPYSSLSLFFGEKRPEKKLLGDSIYEYYDKVPSLESMLHDARAYYTEISPRF